MKYQLVLWDFDGTLADTLRGALDIYNALADKYGVLPISDSAAVREMSPREFIKTHRIPWLKVRLLFREFLAAQHSGIEKAAIFPGIASVLLALRDRGCRLGVVSSNSEKNIRMCLASNGMDNEFQLVVGYSRLFGKERALRRVITGEGISTREVLYIGDEIRDIEAAAKVGVDMVAVAWGFNSAAALREHNPTYLVETPEELTSQLVLSSR